MLPTLIVDVLYHQFTLMNRTIVAAALQRQIDNDATTNLTAFQQQIRDAVAQGAQLVVLPELHAGPYFCQHCDPSHFDLAEPLDGPTSQGLGAVAEETGAVIVGSIFEQER